MQRLMSAKLRYTLAMFCVTPRIDKQGNTRVLAGYRTFSPKEVTCSRLQHNKLPQRDPQICLSHTSSIFSVSRASANSPLLGDIPCGPHFHCTPGVLLVDPRVIYLLALPRTIQ